MAVPPSRDVGAVTERAFASRAFAHEQALDQLQMHAIGNDGLRRIAVARFEMEGQRIRGAGRGGRDEDALGLPHLRHHPSRGAQHAGGHGPVCA